MASSKAKWPLCNFPGCEFPACPLEDGPQGYCCEKCKARADGEEWAMDIKKMHSKICTSKINIKHMMGEKCLNPACGYMVNSQTWISEDFCCGRCEGLVTGEEDENTSKKKHYKNCERIMAAKCAYPECTYRVNSDPYWSEGYCCAVCQGLHKGEEWAQESKKRHFKNCEHVEHGKLPGQSKQKQEDEWESKGTNCCGSDSSKSGQWGQQYDGGKGIAGKAQLLANFFSMVAAKGKSKGCGDDWGKGKGKGKGKGNGKASWSPY
eukprot:TRINITY_DN1642_c0_g1_i1.p1 TRINITY_DN1642_c0_g1~~TRINITY_DN1642_c0_g1_i1.p1  ORF type:complete len:264 (-),score=38.80 TRINITY_DN1642_c0_g1_i1:187-978(-)